MKDIRVVTDGKKFKVLINFIQRGIVFQSPAIANEKAKEIHNKEFPHFNLTLLRIPA